MRGFIEQFQRHTQSHKGAVRAKEREEDQGRAVGRRTTAGALRAQVGRMLVGRLPEGWEYQMIQESGASAARGERACADILVVSPRGRCHFFFAKAPADRWWDGDVRRVPAEPLTEAERSLIARLKYGGHAVRPVWTVSDAKKALWTWGCHLRPAPMPPDSKAVDRLARTRGEDGRDTYTLTLNLSKGINDDR